MPPKCTIKLVSLLCGTYVHHQLCNNILTIKSILWIKMKTAIEVGLACLFVFFFLWFAMSGVRKLERERDEIVMHNEEAITGYYKIRQQLDRLGKQMQV